MDQCYVTRKSTLRFALSVFVALLFSTFIIVVRAQSESMRDPTLPASFNKQQQGANNGLRLSLIRVGQASKHAVINGRVVEKGDSISGYRVTAIEKQSVQLKGSQGHLTLTLLDAIKKQPSQACCKGSK